MSRAKTVRAACAAVACAAAALVGMPAAAYACTAPGGGGCTEPGPIVTVATGTLAIATQPTATIVGTIGASPSFSGSLGGVTVQDGRTIATGWTVTATTAGDLVTSTQPVRTIVLGTSGVGGPLTLATGPVNATQGSLLNVTAGIGGSLNPTQPITVAQALTGFGAGTYTFTPTLLLTPPPSTYAGSYVTTITLTVA